MPKTDAKLALALLIYNEWNGAADLDASIDTAMWGFKTGANLKEVAIHTDMLEGLRHEIPQVSVIDGWEFTEPMESAELEENVLRVFVWVPRRYEIGASMKKQSTLKKWKHQMREEVKRICRLYVGEKAPGSSPEYDELRKRFFVRNADNFRDKWYADEITVRLRSFV